MPLHPPTPDPAPSAPRFSIVMPCRNAARTLPDTIASLQAQTEPRWEAICLDDGSTDETAALLAAAAARDPRLRVVRLDGVGPSRARNHGVRDHAAAPIIAFCDADDLWQPDKLARLGAAFAPDGPAAVFGQVAFYDGDRTARMRLSTMPARPLGIAGLLAENPVCTMSNLSVRREVFLATGGFDETMVHNEDLDWLVRLVGEGHRVIGDPALHVLYRANPRGLSADLLRMEAGRRAALATAARYGVRPDARAEAVYARYLARRALRLDAGPWIALRYALRGIAASPAAFLLPLRRGAATLAAALAAPALPRRLRQRLFAAT